MLQIKVKQCKFTLISAIIRKMLQSLKKEKKNHFIYGLLRQLNFEAIYKNINCTYKIIDFTPFFF